MRAVQVGRDASGPSTGSGPGTDARTRPAGGQHPGAGAGLRPVDGSS